MLNKRANMRTLANWGKKSSTLLGVDISSSSIKILQLSAVGSSLRLDNYVVRSPPANAVVDKNISDIEALGECIGAAVNILKPSVKDAAVAVAGSAVITKTIEMNAALTDSEMENQIVVEADRYIPYPLDEVSVDFERQELSERNPGMVEVLLAACRRENVDTRVSALELGGLSARVVDIEAYAVERAFSLCAEQIGSADRQTVAIIDIGSMMTTLNVILAGRTIYTREQMFGGNALSEEVQRCFGLSAVAAETAMKRGDLPDEYQYGILAPFRETVVQQVSRALQLFFSSSHCNEVDHILLAGGVAAIEGLADQVGESLSTPVRVANPFENMTLGSRVNRSTLNNDAPSLLIACGLAMRGEYGAY